MRTNQTFDDEFFIPAVRTRRAVAGVLLLCFGLALFLAIFETAQLIDLRQPISFKFFYERLLSHSLFLLIMGVVVIVAIRLVRPFIIKKNHFWAYIYTMASVISLVFLVGVISKFIHHVLGREVWNFRLVMLEFVFNALLSAIFFTFALYYLNLQHKRTKLREIELRTQVSNLQTRIAPHFFFNSMNTLLYLVETNSADAPRMVENLSAYFRYSLKKPELISISEEAKLCKHFVAIENLRLEHDLNLSWRFPDSKDMQWIREIKIPSQLVQNLLAELVEQAVTFEAPRQIKICGSHANGKVTLTFLLLGLPSQAKADQETAGLEAANLEEVVSLEGCPSLEECAEVAIDTLKTLEDDTSDSLTNLRIASAQPETALEDTMMRFEKHALLRLHRYFGEESVCKYQKSRNGYTLVLSYPARKFITGSHAQHL